MSDTAETDASHNLTKRTLRAAKWTYLSTIINAGLQVFITATLARLLVPEAFGLVAMGTLVLRFGQYFAQMGVGQAIVQRSSLETEHIRAGFWVSVLIGAAFSLGAWLGSPLAAIVFGSDELTTVLRAMGLTFFITGLSTTAFGMLRRQMRFRAIALAEMASYAVGYAGVGIALALLGHGVWSLVFASLCQSGLVTVLYNLLARPKIAPVTEWRPYRELLGFGSSVSVISFLEFLNSNLDTMVVGRFAGANFLGIYNRALSLTGLPMQYMSTSLSRVLLPSLSRVQTETKRLGTAYLRIITVFAGLGIPIALGMAGAAREIVVVVLGHQWSEAIPVMRIVAVASVAAMLSHFGGVVLEATAQLKDKFLMRIGQLVVFLAALLTLGRLGLVGYALAFAVSEVSLHSVQAVRMSRLYDMRGSEQFSAYWPGLIGGIGTFAVLLLESWAGAALNSPPFLVLVLQFLSGLFILTLTILRAGHGRVFAVVERSLRESIQQQTVLRVLGWAGRWSSSRGIGKVAGSCEL
jgi:lipopolysaccharide exporter